MKTAEVVKELAQLTTKKGTSLATFSNNKWSCEADLNTKDESELKSLANKSFSIVTPMGVYTRPSVTKPWTFEEKKETKMKNSAKKVKEETPVKKKVKEVKEETPVKKAKKTAAERRARRKAKNEKPVKAAKRSAVANGKRSAAEAKTGMTQGAFIKEKILEGLSNKEVYEAMLEFFGEEIVTEKHKTHPAWYRCQMKKNGEL